MSTTPKRKPARKPVALPVDPSRQMLRFAAAISAGTVQVRWEARVLAAIMLVNQHCDEAEAREALQPTLDFYGRKFYPEEDGFGQHFALEAAWVSAPRVEKSREHRRWEARMAAKLAEKKSAFRVLLGGRSL